MRNLASFSNTHLGETILVCGCGQSLNELQQPERFITIGVNDIGRRFHPDYLVVVNPPDQFSGDRFHYVKTSAAKFLFTQLDLGLSRENIIKFDLGKENGTDWSNPDILHYTQNSPYVALCLALHMGAKRIGLIGVDFTDHHFFAPTGTHSLAPQFQIIDQQYARLYEAIKARGLEVFNLSRASRLTAFPKISQDEFAARAQAPAANDESLQIVSYATTPVAGVPAILARCIKARTKHRARCVWATRSYGNGVVFNGDIEWSTAPHKAEAALQAADVVIVHNGKVEPQHRPLLAGKAIVTMAHNYGWNVDNSFVEQGFPGVVVGQYQATLPEFADWDPVPNPIPLWEDAFMPGPKGHAITICFTPSGQHEHYSLDHRLYWHSKGYETTMRILERLAAQYHLQLEVIRNTQVSHAESLAMKRRSHIVIDECVTGSYHRNSLEGLAVACVVVNGMGLLPGVQDVFRRCAGGAKDPFVRTGLDKLETVLTTLIKRGPEKLSADGQKNRCWIESHWDFTQQWKQYWEPVLERALARARPNVSSVKPVPAAEQTIPRSNVNRSIVSQKPKEGVSIIIPHGGRERLPHLMATLVNLQQSRRFYEIIVVDMGEAPYAEEAARRFGDKYIFVHHREAFQRARALNIGTPFAEFDLLLWKDNDLILPFGFIEKAAAELRERQLDNLIPYSFIRYLSEADSREVMAGTRDPKDCTPVNLFKSQYDASGGCGLVRKSFVLKYGGLHEGFRGWGGDDNAWSFKAQLLGRSSATQYNDQHIYHLFHPNSGGYGGNSQIMQNPHYNANVVLMNQIITTRDRDEFIRRFPPAGHYSCPWPKEKQIAFIADAAQQSLAQRIAQALDDLYGIKIECHRVSATDPHWPEQVLERTPDAIVIFNPALAQQVLTDSRLSHVWSRVLLVQERGVPLSAEALSRAGAAPGRNAGPKVWSWNNAAEGDAGSFNEALSLAQPLSVVLGCAEENSSLYPDSAGKQMALPVWIYWEGECPEWIKECQRTIFAHAENVKLVTPDEFEKLRDVDLDIDLKRLSPPQRADFIRAFLLTKFGGLWIDSDCLVMQSLQPLLNLLSKNDFLFHRERSGFVSNGFIGACPGSRIADGLYRRLCEILRSGRPLGWTSLGSEPLTEIINTSNAPCYELQCELIQPICWSQPEAFFQVKHSVDHERNFDEQAICYMLSNNSFKRFYATNGPRNLLDEGTFFRYLLKRALGEQEQTDIEIGNSKSAGSWQQIPFCIEAMLDIAPAKVLDVGIGFGRWGVLLREFANAGKEEPLRVIGIETQRATAVEPARLFYDRIHPGKPLEIIDGINERWNLVIFGEELREWSAAAAEEILAKALNISDYVLVSSQNNGHGGNGHKLSGTLSDLMSANLVRNAEFGGALLLSRSDPRRLKRANPRQNIFERIIASNQKIGDESVCGPGSCLAQTSEIRQRLPFLTASLNVRSLLDAPCGDFNWLKHVELGVDEYIGGDIVSMLVEQNERTFGNGKRRFLHLDITSDYLPEVDLILCRDCLVHFPFTEIIAALKNFKRSHSKYLLTTTFTGPRPNVDIPMGEWRTLNLQQAPFNFPPPLRLINEKCTEANGAYADKCLGLWRLDDLRL
jgi:SAM-dependent methyltransferase